MTLIINYLYHDYKENLLKIFHEFIDIRNLFTYNKNNKIYKKGVNFYEKTFISF